MAAPHRRAAGLRLDHGSVRDSAGKPVLAELRAAQPGLTDFSLSLVSRPSLSPRPPLPASVRSWPPPSRGSLSLALGRAGLCSRLCLSPAPCTLTPHLLSLCGWGAWETRPQTSPVPRIPVSSPPPPPTWAACPCAHPSLLGLPLVRGLLLPGQPVAGLRAQGQPAERGDGRGPGRHRLLLLLHLHVGEYTAQPAHAGPPWPGSRAGAFKHQPGSLYCFPPQCTRDCSLRRETAALCQPGWSGVMADPGSGAGHPSCGNGFLS